MNLPRRRRRVFGFLFVELMSHWPNLPENEPAPDVNLDCLALLLLVWRRTLLFEATLMLIYSAPVFLR